LLIDRLGSLHTQMESLIVLIALENRWPLEEMCYFNSREQTTVPLSLSSNSFTVLHAYTPLIAGQFFPIHTQT
jgi:hypothetical protein